MSTSAVDSLARAVLYEGYLLYPYRASSIKNRQRWTFGALYPETWSGVREKTDASLMQTECLVVGQDGTVDVRVRFLHLVARTGGEIGSWQEAVEREVVALGVTVTSLLAGPRQMPFRFEGSKESSGGFERQQEAVLGLVTLRAEPILPDLARVNVTVRNLSDGGAASDPRDVALLRTFVSTHTLIRVTGAELVSLLDPPEAFRGAASECKNIGTWPVMVGDEAAKSTMLSCPIILYDYPRIAKESFGDLFDATEIDEILTLRILTLTDDEKRQMREVDPRARALLERTEALGMDDLMKLHGQMQIPSSKPDSFVHAGVELRAGSRVRLAPGGRADIFDIALAGKEATILSVEQDFEGQVYFAVSVDDDPGRDLAMEGKPGHRFFFRAGEVTPL